MRQFSIFKNKDKPLIKADIWEQIPTPKPGEVMFIPFHNHFWHPRIAVYANNTKMPEWYDDLQQRDLGLKRCSGLSDYLRIGYTIPMWATVDIRPPLNKNNPNWDAKYDVSPTDFEWFDEADTETQRKFGRHFSKESVENNQFGYAQTGKCPAADSRKRPKANYLKLINPWLIKTAPGYSVFITTNAWEPSLDYDILPGVVNTDYYHHANCVFNVLTDEPFSIPEGTPLMHIIPFKRQEVIKGSSLLKADSSVYKILDGLGFDAVFRSDEFAGKYKAEQNKIDRKLKDTSGG